jgi:hypothetical protein
MASVEMFDADPGEGLLFQGDVLRWERPTETPWREHALVVTASCDLRQNKNRGLISYVPVVAFSSYVRFFWAPEFMDRRLAHQKDVGFAAVRKAVEAARGSCGLSHEAALGWVLRAEVDEVVADIIPDVALAKERRKLSSAVATLKAALVAERELRECQSADAFMSLLSDRLGLISGKAGTDGPGGIRSALEGHCTSLPGDVFFISTVPGGGGGHFAMLRHVSQIEEGDIEMDPVARPGARLPARRVGRLGSPYVYALTQQLGKIFSDIGLPSTHPENLRESLSRHLETSLPR